MKDSQDFKKLTNLAPIKTIEQLLSSYLVADCIIEIRGERNHEIKKLAKDSLPKLNIKNQRAIDLYHRFSNVVNYSPTFVYLCKIGLEDMEYYEFSKDPSVVTSAQQDTSHFNDMLGSSYTLLTNISLEEHTLNVFEKGILAGEKKGRIMQTALPMLACLFHDFGKSSELRTEILGDDLGRGYKAHADVSGTYVREILANKYHKKFSEHSMETTEMLSKIVAFHHPGNNKLKNDTMIKFVIEADTVSRKEELQKIKKQLNS